MKKLIALLVVLVMVVSMIPAAFAAETGITTQPVDASVPVTGTAVFTVEAEGATSYQWQYLKSADGEWTNCGATNFGGVKTNKLSVAVKPARNGYQFRCVVTTAAGELISDAATLTATSIFASGPVDETVKLGSRANFHFEVAEGADLTGCKILWQYQITPGGAWWNNTPFTMGYNTQTLNVIAAEKREGFKYRVRIIDADGNKYYSTEISEAAVLTVDVPFPYAIVEQPKDAYAYGTDNVQFHVETQGEGLTYTWWYDKDINGSFNDVQLKSATGCYTDTLTIAAKSGSTDRNGWWYYAKVKDANGYEYTSGYGRLLAFTAAITDQPDDAVVPVGTNVTYNVTVKGEYENYRWELKKPTDSAYNATSGKGTVVKNADGTTTFSYTVQATAARNGYSYRLRILDKTGDRTLSDGSIGKIYLYSNPVWLLVDDGIVATITENPADVTIEEGQTATFTAAASGVMVTKQWYVKLADSDAWYVLPGETGNSLIVAGTEANNGNSYKMVATDAKGNVAESTAATLELDAGELILAPTMVPGTAETKKIAAGETKTYTVQAGGVDMIIEDENVIVTYNGVEYYPIDGVVRVSLEFVNPRLGTSNVVDITNTGDVATKYTVKFEYPLGSMENPEVVTDLTFFYAPQAEGDTDGYNFIWTAPEAGKLTLALSNYAEGAVYNAFITVGYKQYNWAEESVDGVLVIDVAAGDEVMINAFTISQYAIDEDTWEVMYDEEGNPIVVYYPESATYINGSFVNGSINFPYDLSPMDVPGTAETNVIEAGASEYYTTTASNTVLTFNSQNLTVEYEGVVYAAQNGVVSLYVEGGFDPLTWENKPIVFKVTNIGTAAASFTASYNFPVGHQQNPDALILGDNTQEFTAGDEAYYYTWTANDKGTLTINISGTNGWFYVVNNLTANQYSDWMYSTDEGNETYVIEVEAGDVIQIQIMSWDADVYGSSDGSVTVNVDFSSLVNEGIEIPLPGMPEDGEE